MASVSLCLGIIAAFTNAASIVTLQDLRDLPLDLYSRNLPFTVTGLVTFASSHRILLQDDHRTSFSFWRWGAFPQTGDVIRAEGITHVDPFAEDAGAKISSYSVIGKGDVIAPEALSFEAISRGDGDYRMVTLQGYVLDAFEDEFDANYNYFLLGNGGHTIPVATTRTAHPIARLRALVNRQVRITGICCPVSSGWRRFMGRYIGIPNDGPGIDCLTGDSDFYNVPVIDTKSRSHTRDTDPTSPRRAIGRVLATWPPNQALMADSNGGTLNLCFVRGIPLPAEDELIEAIGQPQTDLTRIHLYQSCYRKFSGAFTDTPLPVEDIDARRLLCKDSVNGFNVNFHGRHVRIRGTVRATTAAGSDSAPCITAESEGLLFHIYGWPGIMNIDDVEIGSVISVTGICNLESRLPTRSTLLPQSTGFSIILRSADGLRVLSRPSPLTPAVSLAAIAVLIGLVVLFLIWNYSLRTLVNRRSRELVKARTREIEAELRIDERNRIAAELHDYLAQNMTAAYYELSAKHFDTATAMLASCRTELRRCLWDLKSKAMDEATFDGAIRRTLQQIIRNENLTTDFDLSRTGFSDLTTHTILSIIRELAANAMNHGNAGRLDVTGRLEGGRLVVTVSDDGCGFDVDAVAASESGHFGLDGIRNRLARLDGTFSVTSVIGGGTVARFTIPYENANTAC